MWHSCLTVSSGSSFSFCAMKGHQPFTLFCLKIEMDGSSCSLIIMSREHSFDDFAPLGNRFKSSSIAPERKRVSLRARNKVDLWTLAESHTITLQVASNPRGENKKTFRFTFPQEKCFHLKTRGHRLHFETNPYKIPVKLLWESNFSYPRSHPQRSGQHPTLAGWGGQGSCTLSHPRRTWTLSWRPQFSPQPWDSQREIRSAS